MEFLPSSDKFKHFFALCVLVLLLGTNSSVKADLLTFQTTNQSMWETGNAGGFDESLFVGTSWDTPTATLGGIAGGVVSTPAIGRKLITPAIPRKLITPAIPRKLLIKAKKVCIPFTNKCATTPAVYSPAIPAVYSPAIPAIYTPAIPALTVDTSTGAQVDVSSTGRVGLEFNVAADAGSVNANVEFDASLTPPEEISAFTLFDLNTESTLLTNSTFDTNFPQLSASANLILGANLDITGQVCAVGNCETGSTNIGFDEFALELVSFNEDNNGKIRFLGDDNLTPAAFNFGEPISVTAGVTEVGNVTVSVPNLQTLGEVSGDNLGSAGSAEFLDLKLDLDGILTAGLGLPPVLGTGIDAGILSFGYDILDIEFGPVLDVIQTFELKPELMVDLNFSESIFVEGMSETVNSLTAAVSDIPKLALGLDQTVDVTTNYWVDATLQNTTQIGIDGEFVLDVLKASFSLEALGASYNLGELGPLFNFTERFDIADLPPLFDKEFQFGDFNSIAGESFTLSTAVAADEPPPAEVKLANSVAVLTTGSPVELSQQVSKPVTDQFEFSFDYLIAQAGSVLDVFLGSTLLTSIVSTDAMLDFATFSQLFDSSIFGTFDVLDLIFRFNGLNDESGHTVLIDNVSFPEILNGNFDIGSVTGELNNWQTSTSSVDGFVGTARLETVSEPGTILIILLGLFILIARQKRPIKQVIL